MALDLTSFQLKKTVLELRYDDAYALWDKAGAIWVQAGAKWPGLKLVKAEPGATVFHLESRTEFGVNLGKSFVISHNPKPDLDEFSSYCEALSEITESLLGLKEYSRLGFRLFYEKKFDTQDGASKAMLDGVSISVPTGRHFNIDGKIIHPELAFRWEGPNIGLRAQLAAQSKMIDFDAPLGVEELESVQVEKDLLVLDIDYYTLARVAVGQFRAKDWIPQAHHLVKRDISKLLKGV